MGVKLQFALDFLTAEDAIRNAEAAAEAGVTCLEAGHVLIKVCGLRIVEELRQRFPDIEIVADMKTMDMGREEVHAAVQAGADTVIVCAAASDGTVLAADQEARLSNTTLLVSLMGVKDRLGRAAHLSHLGLKTFIAHRGLDDDYTWLDAAHRAELRDLVRIPKVCIALAGDVRADTVQEFAGFDFERVIVGRGIYEQSDISKACRALLRSLSSTAIE